MKALKKWTKSDVMFGIQILFALAVFYVVGHYTAMITVGRQAEAAIAVLRYKQPTVFNVFKGYEFNGRVFVNCVKEQKAVKADNTIYCLGQSAYKP